MTTMSHDRQRANEHGTAIGNPRIEQSAILGADLLIRPEVPPRVLIVDDDPVFLRLMGRIAAKENLEVTFARSMEELRGIPDWDFDVAIVDYLLGPITGIDLVEYMETITESPPVVLVSHSRQVEGAAWPESVRDFVHKALGPYAVMDAAYEAFDIDRIYKKMRVGRGFMFGRNPKRQASKSVHNGPLIPRDRRRLK